MRVNQYFIDNDLSKHADGKMKRKSALAFSIYLVPYFIFMTSGIENLYVLFSLWMIMGFGKALIGTSVMHDSVHGSYSNKKSVNKWMSLSAPIVGIDALVWHLQHNVLHHTYTNIEHADEDIHPRYVMRFSPNQPKKWFHRFQHIYASFFYGITTFSWVTTKDYFKLFAYRKKGMIKKGRDFRKHLWLMIFRKALYLFFFLILPMLVLNVPASTTFMMFICMHLIAGISLSMIFQPAHIIPTSNFIDQEEVEIDKNWSVHQLETTSNFAMNSKFITWFAGGLNFQVEHHLFPNICHIHYPKIAGIVQQTASEYDIPYHAYKSFLSAIAGHYKMLKALGKHEKVEDLSKTISLID